MASIIIECRIIFYKEDPDCRICEICQLPIFNCAYTMYMELRDSNGIIFEIYSTEQCFCHSCINEAFSTGLEIIESL
jgi:hypothetical protein